MKTRIEMKIEKDNFLKTIETKPLSLSQRERLSNLGFQSDMIFSLHLFACRCGVLKIDGIEINDENFDNEINKLGNQEILWIGEKIISETTMNKKKGVCGS